MSKRSGTALSTAPGTSSNSSSSSSSSSTGKAEKRAKMDNVWDLIPETNSKVKEFTPVEGGPKTKIIKTHVLGFEPRVEVSISLYGPNPELRFISESGAFTMSGDEFLQMSGSWPGLIAFQRVRLEVVDGADAAGEYRIARYEKTGSGMMELNPIDVFGMSEFSARRLKSKIAALTEHVFMLAANEEVIVTMFKCVAQVYRNEYARMNTVRPLKECFDELSRIVEIYKPSAAIVKDFQDKLQADKLMASVNHYNLLATVLSQRECLCEEFL